MIKVIELTEDLLTGVSEMDKEHQMLVDMLNTVYDLLAEGKREAAKEYFESEIVHYVEYHLSDEEKFMETICYPELETHKKVHEIFRKVVFDLVHRIDEGDEKSFKEALAITWGWLVGHIGKTDKKYGKYAKENGYI